MSLGRLWAGWRSSYMEEVASTEPADDGCLFCALLEGGDDDGQVLAREPLAFAVLNRYPYTSGHLMIAPNRHIGDLAALTDDEANAVMQLTRRAAAALTSAYQPDGVNVGMNLGRAAGAGVPGHLHVHVLPRWIGDTNFMTSVAETRVLPEPLSRTGERLRDAWPA